MCSNACAGREVVEEDIYQIGVVSSGKPMEQMATEVNRVSGVHQDKVSLYFHQ